MLFALSQIAEVEVSGLGPKPWSEDARSVQLKHQRQYRRFFNMTSLSKWYRIKRYFIPAAFLLVAVMIVLLFVVQNLSFRVINGILTCWISVIIFAVMDRTNNKINDLKRHICLDDLSYMAQVSAGELEQMCSCRLQALAGELIQAERAQNAPLRLEESVNVQLKIQRAQAKFREAYWFFEQYKFIQPTDWKYFFSQPIFAKPKTEA